MLHNFQIKQRIEPGAGLIKTTTRPLWSLDIAVNEEDFEDYFKTKFIPRLADKMNISRKKLEIELWEFDRIAGRINIVCFVVFVQFISFY